MTDTGSKNILITGASGMVGSALTAKLCNEGYTVYRLERNSTTAPFYYLQASNRVILDPSIALYAVINLAGPSIADKRWTEARKRFILQSRERLTSALADALSSVAIKPALLLSASAVGFYGEGDHIIADENSPAGSDFLAGVAQQWEQATAPAEQAGINTIHLRFGVVLSPSGGMLKQLLLPFKLGLGGPIGDGQQFLSWISLVDVVDIISFLLEHQPVVAAINLVADTPATSRDFSKALASQLNRPSFLPMPAPMVKLLFGEMGKVLLLGSSRVQSSKLADLGVTLKHPTLFSTFQAILAKS